MDTDRTPANLDCRIRLLTPTGRGAVATISVEGDGATTIVSRLFRPAAQKSLEQFPTGRIVFGWWFKDSGVAEEVVVCRRTSRCIEVNCHGGWAAGQAIIDSLVAQGASEIDEIAWLQSHEPDRIAAQARLALARARTSRTACVLLDQYRGALRDYLIPILDWINQGKVQAAQKRLARLMELAELGLHLTTPWRVVVAGPPNAGKSSLVNAILGFPRSIVFEHPGTTRDVLTSSTALDGWPVELIDTAGLRFSEDAVESEGVARARGQLATADLVILVFDVANPSSGEQEKHLAEWPNAVVAMNKCDLLPGRGDVLPPAFLTSAVTGEGVGGLIREVSRRLVPRAPRAGESVMFLEEHIAAVKRALSALRKGDVTSAISHVAKIL